MKRSPIRRRTPMNRATPGALAWAKKRRKPLHPVSERHRERLRRRKDPRAAQLRAYPYCEPKKAGMEHRCDGPLTVHEPWTRARGGPIDDPRNMVTACMEGNRLISQSSRHMQWALVQGYLVHRRDGPAWLAAGGFRREHDQNPDRTPDVRT